MIAIDIQLSRNFKLSELLRSDTAEKEKIREQFAPSAQIVFNLSFIVQNYLQPLRYHCGVVNITSGYRCKRLNSLVGGSTSSAHLFGYAVDFTVADMKKAVLFLKDYNFDQLIIYPTFIHLGLHFIHERNQIIYR